MQRVLHARGPAPDRAAQMMLYGQFVGSWDGTVVVHQADGARRESSCEVHFGWALEGRAIQDVWIAPALRCRKAGDQTRMYGTTLRVYDPESDLWHITWIDPVKQAFNRMTGRRHGDDIVQEYVESGVRRQWLFTEILADSFHWVAREASGGRDGWKVLGEFFLRRRAADPPAPAVDTPEHRAFDFWIGDWAVTDAATGAALGDNRIERILGGSALHEHWTGANGVSGESLSVYDAARAVWHQTWVDETGAVLLLDGGVHEGAIELEGRDPAGVLHRIRWAPGADGSVLQYWERSADEGRSWLTVFHGQYRRKP